MRNAIRTSVVSAVLLLAHGGVTLIAQEPEPVLIIGTVRDSSDGRPLPDAVVYVPNSGIGTATGPGGRFTLRLPSRDRRDIVAALVGYRRERITVPAAVAETLDLDIRLAPQPVMPGGVDVVAAGGGLAAGQPLFFPAGGGNAWCAYGSETEIPVGILFTEKALYMYALERDSADDESCARLWLLVFNVSKDTLAFDALRDVTLDMRSGGKAYRGVKAVPPPAAGPPGAPIRAQRPLAVERTLTVMANQSQFFVDEARRFDRNACDCPWPWTGPNSPDEHPAGVNPRYLMEVYDRCTHAGALGSYRIFPAGGVDGFIRYPLPGFRAAGSGSPAGEEFAYTYEFTLSTPSGDERIVFTAH